MNSYVTGNIIKSLREKKGYTQKQLADVLMICDKTVSKWETQRGLPDITLLEPLATALNVSIAELISGECITNSNRSGNMFRTNFYVCPICGNVIFSTGNGSFSCCGINLPVQQTEETNSGHEINVEQVEYDYYVTLNHPMTKTHYLSFIAYVTTNKVQLLKLYPEQNPEVRFPMSGNGYIYAYCNQDGLFRTKI